MQNKFWIYNKCLYIAIPKEQSSSAAKQMLNLFKEEGFEITPHENLLYSKYPKYSEYLEKYYYYGQKKDLYFSLNLSSTYYGFKCEIDFYSKRIDQYQVVKEFSYLLELAYNKIVNKAISLFPEYEDATTPDFASAYEEIMYDRKKQNYTPSLNVGYDIDKNKVQMKDGDFRYFRDYKGRINRGIVYHNINNMWWVDANKQLFNMANFELFEKAPANFKKRAFNDIVGRLRSRMIKAVKEYHFEKAIIFRNLIEQYEPLRVA